MMNKEIKNEKLFNVIWEYVRFEFGSEWDESLVSDIKEELKEDISKDYVDLTHSEFGSSVTFQGQTSFIPSELALTRCISCYEYNGFHQEKIYFDNIDCFKKYLINHNFDEMLEPEEIEEEILLNNFKLNKEIYEEYRK